MRTAFLLPAEPPFRTKDYHRTKNFALDLAHGLLEKDVEVVVFSDPAIVTRALNYTPELLRSHIDVDADIKEHLVYSMLLDHAEEFDLIHNHAGTMFIPLAGNTSTPLLTTVYDPPGNFENDVLRTYCDRSFYVAAVSGDCVSGLQCMDTIDPASEDVVESYIKVYERIREIKKREDHRPWGYYRVLADEPDHKVKRIVVYPGKRLSLQRHKLRAELWEVVYGKALVTLDDKEIEVGPGECVRIPRNTAHRIKNPGEENLAFIEVQSGEYFGEDDIERLEDDFGRS